MINAISAVLQPINSLQVAIVASSSQVRMAPSLCCQQPFWAGDKR